MASTSPTAPQTDHANVCGPVLEHGYARPETEEVPPPSSGEVREIMQGLDASDFLTQGIRPIISRKLYPAARGSSPAVVELPFYSGGSPKDGWQVDPAKVWEDWCPDLTSLSCVEAKAMLAGLDAADFASQGEQEDTATDAPEDLLVGDQRRL